MIEAEGKKIIYTGDFRAHGNKQEVFDYFINKAPKEVDVLLMEGTMIGRLDEDPLTEEDVVHKMNEVLRINHITLVTMSSMNIDRFVSLYKASYLLKVLKESTKYADRIPWVESCFPEIKVYFPKSQQSMYSRSKKYMLQYNMKSFASEDIEEEYQYTPSMLRSLIGLVQSGLCIWMIGRSMRCREILYKLYFKVYFKRE